MADKKQTESLGKLWAQRIKVLLISGILASIANMIYDWRMGAEHVHMPWEVCGALLYMFVIIVVSYIVHDLLAKVLPFQVPAVLYVATFTAILSFPALGWPAAVMKAEFAKIGLLPLCTPILAYAGISSGKDLDTFKKQGVAIVCTAILAFVGTYIGSAIIAQIILSATNVI
ncbi:MAG: DUF340 domain-containing protein [Firmicutes bacterium]|nr:DUF340 domain-containing protein [Bacillota bacterium]